MIYSRSRNVLSLYELFFWSILIVLGILAIVWLRSSIAGLEYSIGELEKTKVELVKEKKQLLAEKAELSSFARLRKMVFSEGEYIFPDRRYISFHKRGDMGVRTLPVADRVRIDSLLSD